MFTTFSRAHVSRIWFALIVAFLCTALLAQTSVLTQHNDNNRDGVDSAETTLTPPANVNSAQFEACYSRSVDGMTRSMLSALYGECAIINGTRRYCLLRQPTTAFMPSDA